jgi:TfoX/Sxy family transcriptional regulator of competence genes
MEMPKPTPADLDRFRSVVPDDPRVEVKPMFGNLGAFVNGNMFMGLFGSSIGVKLDDAGREELSGVDGAGPFGPAERPMGGYVSLPPAWGHGPEAVAWAERSLGHVASLPPKAPKPRSAKSRKA